MIEINLLPGSGRKSKRMGLSSGLSTMFSGVSGQVGDPYLIAAVGSAVLCIAAVGFLWFGQKGTERSLMDQEQLAMTDSAQFAPVILEKRRAEMRRDSALNQVRLIQAIDDDRFVWPHLLAEISKAVPAFTWLSEVLFIGEAVSPAAPIPVNQAALDSAATPADSAALLVPRSDPTRPRPPLRFTISGYTADVQAMTRLIRDLESSPFIENVQLKMSKAEDQQGSVVTSFQLDAAYQKPDSSVVVRAPFVASVR